MTEKAKKAQKAYLKTWREKNKEHIRAYDKKWRADNKDKVKAKNERYWEKKAAMMEGVAHGENQVANC